MKSRNRSTLYFPISACLLSIVASTGLPASAEIVHLNDGSQVEGIVKRGPDGYDVTDTSGKLLHIPMENVQRIEIGSKPKSVVETESRLQSMRRSVENVTDVKTIIDRYLRFIDQNKDSPIAQEARADLKTWRERQEKAMVKVGTRWVTAEEKDELRKNETAMAAQIRQMLLQGRMKDAERQRT